MDKIYEADAISTPPSPPAIPSAGYPTNGNPSSGQAATLFGAYWFHMITAELRAVITAAGITPDHTDLGQLLEAIKRLCGGYAEGVSKSGTQSILDGVPLKVTFNNLIFPAADPLWWSAANNRMVVSEDGLYRATANVLYQYPGGTGFPCFTEIWINGSFAARGSEVPSSNANTSTPVCVPINLDAGDYVEVYANIYGADTTIGLGPAANYFYLERIGNKVV